MNQKIQEQQITKSLQITTAIFKSCNATYRILGSILIVAHTKKAFRRIGDVDILLDKENKDCVFENLKSNGFIFKKKRKFGFSWFETKKENYLGLTFLLIGSFMESYFSYRFFKICELRICAEYIQPTEYIFNEVKFIGIPISSIITGIKQSFFNPKRKLDKKVLNNTIKSNKAKTYNNFNIYITGVRMPYLFDIFSFLYNIYGGIRVLCGRKYEVWD